MSIHSVSHLRVSLSSRLDRPQTIESLAAVRDRLSLSFQLNGYSSGSTVKFSHRLDVGVPLSSLFFTRFSSVSIFSLYHFRSVPGSISIHFSCKISFPFPLRSRPFPSFLIHPNRNHYMNSLAFLRDSSHSIIVIDYFLREFPSWSNQMSDWVQTARRFTSLSCNPLTPFYFSTLSILTISSYLVLTTCQFVSCSLSIDDYHDRELKTSDDH